MKFLLLSLLLLAFFSGGCKEESIVERGNAITRDLLAEALILDESSGVMIPDQEATSIYGYGRVILTHLEDDRLEETDKTMYYGLMADSNFRNLELTFSSVDGDSLSDLTDGAGIWGRYAESTALAGSVSIWTMKASNGSGIDSGKVTVPLIPGVTNFLPYDTVDGGNGFTIRTDNTVTGGRAYVLFSADRLRNVKYRHDTSSIAISQVVVASADDGNIEISASDLLSLPRDRYYIVTVGRSRYAKATRNDGREVGLLATSNYQLPLYID